MASTAEATAVRPAHRVRGGVREVVALAYPVVLSNLSVTTLQVVDTAFVGRLGPTELGAVGYGGVWFWTALCFFMGTATGVQTFVSQAHGANRERECGAWAWHSIYWLAPTAGLAMGAFALAFPVLLGALGPAADLQATAAEYVRPRAFGAPGAVAAMALASFFRGVGNTRTPLYAMLAANILNGVLDYGLIFGNFGLPRLGVAGAGVASSIAEWTYAGLLLAAFLRPARVEAFRTRPVRPDADARRRLARISFPIGGQWFLDMITFALFTTLVARMGTEQMAASQAFLVLLHLSFMQVIGVSVAAGILVGRYVGAGDIPAAVRAHGSSLRIGLGLAVVVGILFLAIPDTLLRIFTTDDQVLTLGAPLLAMGALFQLLDAVGIIAGGALRGAGDTRWPFVVQSSLAWFAFLPLAYLFGVVLDGGLLGAWLGGCAWVLLLAIALQARFRSGKWQTMSI